MLWLSRALLLGRFCVSSLWLCGEELAAWPTWRHWLSCYSGRFIRSWQASRVLPYVHLVPMWWCAVMRLTLWSDRGSNRIVAVRRQHSMWRSLIVRFYRSSIYAFGSWRATVASPQRHFAHWLWSTPAWRSLRVRARLSFHRLRSRRRRIVCRASDSWRSSCLYVRMLQRAAWSLALFRGHQRDVRRRRAFKPTATTVDDDAHGSPTCRRLVGHHAPGRTGDTRRRCSRCWL